MRIKPAGLSDGIKHLGLNMLRLIPDVLAAHRCVQCEDEPRTTALITTQLRRS
ncbi:MAG: hypothetical protein AAGF28_07305 [Pseudomonadota bacterium]